MEDTVLVNVYLTLKKIQCSETGTYITFHSELKKLITHLHINNHSALKDCVKMKFGTKYDVHLQYRYILFLRLTMLTCIHGLWENQN